MLTIDDARQLLGDEAEGLTDQELAELCARMYALALVVRDEYTDCKVKPN